MPDYGRPDYFDAGEYTCETCQDTGLLDPPWHWRRRYCACPEGEAVRLRDEDGPSAEDDEAGMHDWPTDEGLAWQAGRVQRELKR